MKNMLPSAIVVLTLLSCTCGDNPGDNPGVQVVLTNKGLQYGKHVAAGWVQSFLDKVTVPDIKGDINIKIGTVHYTITGTTITKCDFPEPEVEFIQDISGLKMSISGLDVALNGRWMTDFWIIHDGGTFDMAIYGVNVASEVQLEKDASGHLSLTNFSCSAEVGNVDMWLHGGGSWLVQHFVSHFKENIRSQIKMTICPAVKESLDTLDFELQAMNVSFDVDQVLALDLSLTLSPAIQKSSLNLGLKGEFYDRKNPADPPFAAQPFVLPEQPSYMLSAGLSDFTLNSASYGYFSAGLLQVLINDSMIPPSSPVRLNTSSIGKFIPQLPKMFPDLLMILHVYAKDTPMFSLQPGVVKLSIQIGVKAFAIAPNSTQIPLFVLDVGSKFSGKMWIKDETLKGSMMMDNFTLTLASTEIGPFQTDTLEDMMGNGLKCFVLPIVNQKLGKGIILPRAKNMQLVYSTLKMEKGFVVLLSDVKVIQACKNSV
ncbi:bactericidal permeability-increasing protein [Pholidichthys leucotaenia]